MRKDFIFSVIIGVLALLLLKDCGGGPGEVIEVIKTDTVTVIKKGKPDTVFFEVERVVYRNLPTEVISIDTSGGDTLRTFETAVRDSLIEGTITTVAAGQVKSVGFTYKPLFPKYITRVDTFKQTIETIIEKKRLGLYLGFVAGANNTSFSFTPTIMLKGRRNYAFSAGYDLLNKTYHVGAFRKLK